MIEVRDFGDLCKPVNLNVNVHGCPQVNCLPVPDVTKGQVQLGFRPHSKLCQEVIGFAQTLQAVVQANETHTPA